MMLSSNVNFMKKLSRYSMAFMEDGNFQEIQMSMSFVESRTLDKQDIERGF